MAVAVDATTIVSQIDGDTTEITLPFVGAGTTITGVVLTISWYESIISVDGISISTIVAGASLPLDFVRVGEITNNGIHTELWVVGVRGGGVNQDFDITITWGGDIATGAATAFTVAYGLDGVGSSTGAHGLVATASGNTSAPTVDVVKESDGGLVVAGIGVYYTASPPVITVDASDQTEAAQGTGGNALHESSYETTAAAAGASVTMNASITVAGVPTNYKWGIVAVEVLDTSPIADPILCGGIVPSPLG